MLQTDWQAEILILLISKHFSTQISITSDGQTGMNAKEVIVLARVDMQTIMLLHEQKNVWNAKKKKNPEHN